MGEKGDTCSIGDLAREFGVTTRAIRFYEDKGLLSPGRQGQTRVYGTREWVRLKLIVRGKRLGFSLRELHEMLDMYDAPSGEEGQLRLFIGKIRHRRSELKRQKQDIDAVLREMDELEIRCDGILAESAVN